MIKVVVADDEVNVCQLICNLVDWEAFDMEIVGVAHNGIEALELVEQYGPDLMVTDIRMPGYDGLEMIGRAKKVKKNLEFIIISGYSHFEYAQSAIKYDACDYLLKPIKKEELTATLTKLREKYRQRTEQLSNEEQLKLRLQSDIGKLRAGLFSELLLNQPPQQPITLEQLNEIYHFNFCPGCFRAFIIKLDCPCEQLYPNRLKTKTLEDKVLRGIQGALEPVCHDMQLCFTGSRAYGILNFDENDRAAVRKQLKIGMDEMLVHTGMFEHIELTIGLGKTVGSVDRLSESLRTAENAAAQRLLEGTGKLLEDTSGDKSAFDGDGLLSDLNKSMATALEVLDKDMVCAALSSFREQALASPGLSGRDLFQLALSAYRICSMILRNHHVKAGDIEADYQNFVQCADLCSSVASLLQHLSRTVTEAVDTVLSDRQQADKKPVRAAKQYIQENFKNPVSLEEVADFVGFNATYFSTLFKKESGTNFQEYLSEVRMDKAKELLKETNLTVANICSQVGYQDLKHFVKIFKKYTGLKPNEYRKLFS